LFARWPLRSRFRWLAPVLSRHLSRGSSSQRHGRRVLSPSRVARSWRAVNGMPIYHRDADERRRDRRGLHRRQRGGRCGRASCSSSASCSKASPPVGRGRASRRSPRSGADARRCSNAMARPRRSVLPNSLAIDSTIVIVRPGDQDPRGRHLILSGQTCCRRIAGDRRIRSEAASRSGRPGVCGHDQPGRRDPQVKRDGGSRRTTRSRASSALVEEAQETKAPTERFIDKLLEILYAWRDGRRRPDCPRPAARLRRRALERVGLQGSRGAADRVPVRARHIDAGGNCGQHFRPGARRGMLMKGGAVLESARQDHSRGVRQDRHADRRQAEGHRHHRRFRTERGRYARNWQPTWKPGLPILWPRPFSLRRKARGIEPGSATERQGHRWRGRGWHRQCEMDLFLGSPSGGSAEAYLWIPSDLMAKRIVALER
jgi:hypothetical protein